MIEANWPGEQRTANSEQRTTICEWRVGERRVGERRTTNDEWANDELQTTSRRTTNIKQRVRHSDMAGRSLFRTGTPTSLGRTAAANTLYDAMGSEATRKSVI